MLERIWNNVLQWINTPFSADHVIMNRIRLVNIFILLNVAGMAIFVPFMVFSAPNEVPLTLAVSAVTLVNFAFLRYLLVRGHLRTASILILVIQGLLITAVIFMRGIYSPAAFGYIILLLLTGLLLGGRSTIPAVVLIILLELIATIGTYQGWIIFSPSVQGLSLFNYWMMHSIIFLFTAGLVYLAVENLQQALGRAQDELVRRKQAQEALRASEERYRLLVESARDLVFTTDVNGRLLSLNPAFEQILGWPREEWLGKLPLDLLHAKEQQLTIELYQKMLANDTAVPPTELRLTHRDGHTVIVEVSASLQAYGGERLILGIGRDATARHKAEAMLQQKQKLESLGLLAGSIAHDFNNLLVGMLGQTTLALQKLPQNSPARPALDKAAGAAERASEITRQLLAYSGQGQFEMGPTSLNALITENLELFSVAVPKQIMLRSELADELSPILADRGQMQQVIMNLILNAAEAIGDNEGSILLQTSTRTIGQADTRFWERTGWPLPPGDYVGLCVSDTGRGMTAETLARLFDPFFTTRRRGHGLGLAAVLGIVRGHGGGICVSSSPDEGTLFELIFPPTTLALPSADQRDWLPIGMRGTLLVIDDEEPVRDAVTDILSTEGMTVLTASDGMEGLQRLREHADRIDLILLDLTMPGMSGAEAFKSIRQLNGRLPVIVSSGYSEQESMERFTESGPTTFLQKPYSFDQLILKVRETLLAGDVAPAHTE